MRLDSDLDSLESLRNAILREAEAGLVGYQPTGDNLLTWAEKNRNFKGKPFGLGGHEYLREMYETPWQGFDYCVLQKAAQMGASEYAMTQLLWLLDKNPKTKGIFFLPSERLVLDFSNDRIDPILNESPRLQKISGGNVGFKQIGHSSLYMRGMFHKAAVKSVDADYLIFDELDEAKPKNKQQAIERISHSDYRYVLELSTPTLPGYGIDLVWGETDMRYWHLACGCHEGCVLEDTFPECIGQRDGLFFLRCPRCGKERLNPCEPATVGEYRGWIPKMPGAEKRGYHLTQLFSTVIPLHKIWELWISGRDREEFYNSKIGIPYAGDRMPLTLDVLRRCYGDGYALEPKREHSSERIFMAADQGIELHIVIGKLLDNGKIKIIWLERNSFGNGNDPFVRLQELYDKVKPTCTVIDAMPNIGPARLFAQKNKHVYIAHYNDTTKDKLKFDKKAEVRRVIAHRTDTLDEMCDDWIEEKFVLPLGNPECEFAFTHLKSLAKVIETDEDTGVSRYVYIHIGPDHYGHAWNYLCMAARYPYGKSHFDML